MKKITSKWFSKAIFKESFKGNYLSFLIVGIGNALIAFIVILILSTLGLNSTKQSMLNMFNTAKMEHTLKQGSVGAYITFNGIVEGYEKVLPQAENYLFNAYDGVNYSTELLNGDYDLMLDAIELFYNSAYETSGSENKEEKHNEAKESTITFVSGLIGLTDINESQIELVLDFIGNYLDEVYISTSENEIKENALKVTIDNYINESSLLNGLVSSEDVLNLIEDTKNDIDSESNKTEIIKENILEFISNKAGEYANYINDIVDLYLTTYIDNKSNYLNNIVLEGDALGLRDKTFLTAIEKIINLASEEFLYYEYLPEFTVNYVTNELGQPIYYETKIVDGKETEVEVVIEHVNDRDKLIPVKENMGLYSNVLQKMNKLILTGEEYNENEIEIAKEEAKENIETYLPLIEDFFTDFLNNKDCYFDAENEIVLKENIKEKVSNLIKNTAKTMIPSFFCVSSFDEINEENIGLDGEELLIKAYDFSFSSMSIFDKEKDNEIESGRNEIESSLIAFNRASKSTLDELPVDVSVKLNDLASRNLYGLVVGVILFSIAGLLLPIVYSILTANSLVAEQVESGSLAFTLSSPIKRKAIIISKAFYLIFAITSMYLLTFLFSVIGREIGIAIGGTDFIESLTVLDLAKYALGSYLVSLAISGICFLSSSIFNKTKYAIGIGGGISIFFLVASILGLFGSEVMPLALRIDSMNFFNYLTIIRLFDVQSILTNNDLFFYLLIPLILISLIAYSVACIIFTKKDLPL